MGTPLFGPLRYTGEGIPNGPDNNGISAVHLGIMGNLFPALEYRLMATHSQNFGLRSASYEPVRNQFFSMASVRYTFPARPGMYAEARAAFDRGTLWTSEHATNTGLNLSFGFTF